MKRFLALFLSVILALPLGTLGAFADTDYTGTTSGQSGDIGLGETVMETTASPETEEEVPDETVAETTTADAPRYRQVFLQSLPTRAKTRFILLTPILRQVIRR